MLLKTWLQTVTNPKKREIQKYLQNTELKTPKGKVVTITKRDIQGLDFDEKSEEVELICEDFTFDGVLDSERNGFGRFRFNHPQGLSIQGSLKEGCLDGNIIEETYHEKREEVIYIYGRKHGLFRLFRWDNAFLSVGFYENGRKVYPILERCSGNSYLIRTTDSEFVYLYPNLDSAIKGTWSNGGMNQGVYGSVASIQFIKGIALPVIDLSEKDRMGCYDPSTSTRISSKPLHMDPYDEATVTVSTSSIGEIAGEGLFAMKKILSGSLVCLFNGLRITKDGLCKRIKPTDNEWSDYRLTLDKSTDLDIPDEYISLSSYRATMGHKACHSFQKKNSRFENLYHPRFGEIMSIVATKDILPGDEIFVNYNYDLAYSPAWYLSLWKEYIQKE